jgi:hypothetical protein
MTEKSQFTLTGFTQHGEFRVFTFARAEAKNIRVEYSVKADITLIRKYVIQLQELPLLCRSLLERPEDMAEAHSFTFTEEDMKCHAANAATVRREAAQRRKSPRRPPNTNIGGAWRGNRGLPASAQAQPATATNKS